jgi:hypothetical protein
MAGANGITSTGGSSKAAGVSRVLTGRIAELHRERMKFGAGDPRGRAANERFKAAVAGVPRAKVAAVIASADKQRQSQREAIRRITSQRGGGPGMRQIVKDIGGRVR